MTIYMQITCLILSHDSTHEYLHTNHMSNNVILHNNYTQQLYTQTHIIIQHAPMHQNTIILYDFYSQNNNTYLKIIIIDYTHQLVIITSNNIYTHNTIITHQNILV